MLIALLEAFFGCRHTRTTWPLCVVKGERVPTYTVCVDCGKEFRYRMPRGLEAAPVAAVGKPVEACDGGCSR